MVRESRGVGKQRGSGRAWQAWGSWPGPQEQTPAGAFPHQGFTRGDAGVPGSPLGKEGEKKRRRTPPCKRAGLWVSQPLRQERPASAPPWETRGRRALRGTCDGASRRPLTVLREVVVSSSSVSSRASPPGPDAASVPELSGQGLQGGREVGWRERW